MVSIEDVKISNIFHFCEENGSIAFIEGSRDIPFCIKRIFYVYGVRTGDVRGHHAHKECKQFLICLNGMVTVTCDDGTSRKSYHLDSRDKGLYVPPMIWAEQFYHSPDSVLLCLADKHYDEKDYIREYSKYKELL